MSPDAVAGRSSSWFVARGSSAVSTDFAIFVDGVGAVGDSDAVGGGVRSDSVTGEGGAVAQPSANAVIPVISRQFFIARQPRLRGTDAIKRSVLAKAHRRWVRGNVNVILSGAMAGDLVSCADCAQCRSPIGKRTVGDRSAAWLAVEPYPSATQRCARNRGNQCLRVRMAAEVHSLGDAGFGEPGTGHREAGESRRMSRLICS